MAKFGEYNPDGSVKVEADECILTERKLAAPFDDTVRYSVKGTRNFFRILGSQHHLVTAEQLAEWRNDYPDLEPETVAVVDESPVGKKKTKWSIEPVVSSDSNAGSENES